MPNYLRILIAFIFAITLSITLMPFFGGFYEYFFPSIGRWFWGPPHPEYIPGFIIAYMFSLPLFFLSLLERKKIFWLLIGILPVIVLILWARQGNTLIMGVIALIIGASLGLLAAKLAKIGEKN